MKCKKASHVGFILSFVIFITSIVFLYTLLQPSFQTNMEKQNVLDYLIQQIVSNSTIEYTSISFNFQNNFDAIECLEFENFISTTEINDKLISKNEQEGFIQSYTSSDGDNLVIEKGPVELNFSRVLASDEFDSLNSLSDECLQIETVSYTIGLIRSQEDIFSSKIIELINAYGNDYESLKSEWNIPDSSDFMFEFTYKNDTTISGGTLPQNAQINIYSDEESIQYINANGVRETGKLNVGVW